MAVAAAVAIALWGGRAIDAQQTQAKYVAPRVPGGQQPNLNGIWQVMGRANWDLEPHGVEPGPPSLGALISVPAGLGVVDGGRIPYTPAAMKQRAENRKNRWTEDPEAKCYLPGVPRFVYLPYPFQIIQSTKGLVMTSEFATATRLINMGNPQEPPVDSWMGQSDGRWEGDTLVIDTEATKEGMWLDRSGNFASENVRIVERFTLVSAERMSYEATLTDKTVYTKPWRISMQLYRHADPGAQLLEYKCVDLAEPFIWGKYYKNKPTQ
jgi:hypothetical protein